MTVGATDYEKGQRLVPLDVAARECARLRLEDHERDCNISDGERELLRGSFMAEFFAAMKPSVHPFSQSATPLDETEEMYQACERAIARWRDVARLQTRERDTARAEAARLNRARTEQRLRADAAEKACDGLSQLVEETAGAIKSAMPPRAAILGPKSALPLRAEAEAEAEQVAQAIGNEFAMWIRQIVARDQPACDVVNAMMRNDGALHERLCAVLLAALREVKP